MASGTDIFPDTGVLDEALARNGLIARGGFVFAQDDDPPPGPSGKPARSVVLAGHGGSSLWPFFREWHARQPASMIDPLDTCSRHVLDPIADTVGARAVYPSDKPWLPFQQWAMRAEGLKPSPPGILMHPDFGLWHAYRGALLFDVEIAIEPPRNPIHLCDACDGKPCMNSCPVDAVTDAGFDHASCRDHVVSAPGNTCRYHGCLARAACPFGTYAYCQEQAAFHMEAFVDGFRPA